MWDCRRSQIHPTIAGFETKIKLNLRWKSISALHCKSKTLKEFYQKWALLFTIYIHPTIAGFETKIKLNLRRKSMSALKAKL